MRGGLCAVLVLLAPIGVSAQAMAGMPGMGGDDPLLVASGRSIVAMMRHPMMPGLEGVRPSGATFVPGEGGAPASALAEATASQERPVADGDTVALEATLVRRTIGGHTIAMYAFNGQAPGPLLRVRQGATIFVRFHNATDRPATIHWHGVRVANRYDGSPDATQPPLAPGASFVYAVHCPDAGIFWYHDHVREDIGQPMGLYGNLIVDPPTTSAGAPTRVVPLILGDLLLDGDSVVPFGADAPNFALMGRFGNVVLVNGDPHWQLTVATGEVVRLLLTNASSARTYNVSVGTAPMKLIASDQGAYLHEVMVPSIVIAPGERYVVDVRFDRPGDVALVNEVQTIDHFLGEFIPQVDTLGHVLVAGPAHPAAAGSSAAAFAVLHEDSAAVRDVARFRSEFDRAPDEEIVLTTTITDLPIPVMQFMSVDTLFRPALEWTDGMSDMNWVATGREVRWIIRDRRTGLEDMAINWHFHQGSVIKIRVFNDPRSLHPMDHPLHLHGQRFLVVARDGTPNPYLVWKDTAIIPVGSTVDLLVDLSNPGTWMLHCHIGEHLAAGMMAALTVDPNLGATQ